MTNLSLSVIETARRRGEEIAIRLDESEVSFSNLDAASACVAGLLVTRGLRPGDAVGVMLPNVPYFAMVYYGVLRAGGVVVPMNLLLTKRETASQLSDCDAAFLFAWPDAALMAQSASDVVGAECFIVTPGEFEELIVDVEPLAEPVARADSDTAAILYSPGVNGSPQRAVLTHASLRGNIAAALEMLHLSESDVVLGAMPSFHAFAQTAGLNAVVAAGSCLTLVARFTPEQAIKVIERDRVTVFEGVSAMFAAMANCSSRGHTTTLRLSVSGGAALPAEVVREFEEAFGCPVLETDALNVNDLNMINPSETSP